MSRQVTHDGRSALIVHFTFDRRLIEIVKGLPNRRWMAAERHWSVPDTDVVLLVDALAGSNFRFDEATREAYRRMGGSGRVPAAAPAPEAAPLQRGLFDAPAVEVPLQPADAAAPSEFTVAQLNESVRQVLEAAFPDSLWLVGEISGFNKGRHRQIVGFNLVELDDDGRKVAEVGATLFATERQMIERGLHRAGDPFRLEDEIRVRVKVRVELYVPWGSYRVIVEDLDLTYTLGEAARRREEIVRRLAEEGLTGVNSALPLPALPLAVGLVTSLGSDAYNDVKRTLQESGYAFRLTAHGARVQGRQTEASVKNALDWFRERAADFDVVLICRGGGSRTDLAWFDSEALGRVVACFPIPVVVGIGHELDHSVLDAVARRAKTPTAAAGVLVDAVRQREEHTERLGCRIMEEALERIAAQQLDSVERGRRLAFATRSLLLREGALLLARQQRAARGTRASLAAAGQALARSRAALPRAVALLLARHRQGLAATLRSMAHGARRDLDGARVRATQSGALLGPRAERLLARRAEQLMASARRLTLSDPRRVVERGYSILRDERGRVVTAVEQAPVRTGLLAELRSGTLRLRSEGPAAETREPARRGGD